MGNVYVEPEDVWDVYLEMVTDGEESCVIAENVEFGVSVWLTDEPDDEGILEPMLYVESDGELLDFRCFTEETAEDIAHEVYDAYIITDAYEISKLLCACEESEEFEEFDNEVNEDGYLVEAEIKQEIAMRNEELKCATMDFLDILLYDCKGDVDKASPGLLRDVLVLVSDRLIESGISVRWPMFKTEPDGSEFYTEYPFDD